ncbi:hypothetical protein DERP_012309 [Dermatophagoides pteronyssinus]|uniref:Uncharacterized protein n=1 Tax=Dermatophagoides pteronyssinus TaxID=6956 RepID=A0ABQ8JQD5_DERPT|nr:hypothetical protein DERP_012309 [Dermatophagoides pteronyssinus]
MTIINNKNINNNNNNTVNVSTSQKKYPDLTKMMFIMIFKLILLLIFNVALLSVSNDVDVLLAGKNIYPQPLSAENEFCTFIPENVVDDDEQHDSHYQINQIENQITFISHAHTLDSNKD